MKKWSDADKQAFRDGQRLRAQTIPPQRREGPDVDEWDEIEGLIDCIESPR